MCEEKRWEKIKASKNGPSFSHIFFADDLMLFAKANSKNCNAILEVLNNFCDLASQKVNWGKSRIFFSSNIPRRRKRQLCRKMGIEATNNLGRYLGFPILHQGRNGNSFNFVLERIQSKLAGWKTKLLSRVGRMVLVQTAAAPIVDYYMQCHAIPIKVSSAIDKAMRDFLWELTEEKRKLHLVNWQTVTLPKELGGLGLFQAKHRNLALLAKLCWRLANEPNTPWAKMIICNVTLFPSKFPVQLTRP
ncbi:putative ribonuclease h protein [Quercus suber]|uniref:Ribonuclease h protein n=1 Tax=Quercus suber TaxID=58331 RepID=A0AAW0M371_QUESU